MPPNFNEIVWYTLADFHIMIYYRNLLSIGRTRDFVTILEKRFLSTKMFSTPGLDETETEERPILLQGVTVNGTPNKKTIGV